MSELTCVSCGREGTDRQRIENESTGETVAVCWDCLRSKLRAKADASDEKARQLLVQDAERHGWEVWSTENVLYMLPPLETDATAEETEEDEESLVDVAHG